MTYGRPILSTKISSNKFNSSSCFMGTTEICVMGLWQGMGWVRLYLCSLPLVCLPGQWSWKPPMPSDTILCLRTDSVLWAPPEQKEAFSQAHWQSHQAWLLLKKNKMTLIQLCEGQRFKVNFCHTNSSTYLVTEYGREVVSVKIAMGIKWEWVLL